MKLVTFEQATGVTRPGVLVDGGVVDVGDAAPGLNAADGQAVMQSIIDGFDALRPVLERAAERGPVLDAATVCLRAPLPRPGKILCCGALQDGETAEIEIERIGRMAVNVADPLKRTWERGVYKGEGSTYRGDRRS